MINRQTEKETWIKCEKKVFFPRFRIASKMKLSMKEYECYRQRAEEINTVKGRIERKAKKKQKKLSAIADNENHKNTE